MSSDMSFVDIVHLPQFSFPGQVLHNMYIKGHVVYFFTSNDKNKDRYFTGLPEEQGTLPRPRYQWHLQNVY